MKEKNTIYRHVGCVHGGDWVEGVYVTLNVQGHNLNERSSWTKRGDAELSSVCASLQDKTTLSVNDK